MQRVWCASPARVGGLPPHHFLPCLLSLGEKQQQMFACWEHPSLRTVPASSFRTALALLGEEPEENVNLREPAPPELPGTILTAFQHQAQWCPIAWTHLPWVTCPHQGEGLHPVCSMAFVQTSLSPGLLVLQSLVGLSASRLGYEHLSRVPGTGHTPSTQRTPAKCH